MTDTRAFAFGKNWQRFVAGALDEERIAEAEKSLKEFFGLPTLQGKTFIDIGCGSGLFSLAAHRLGAEKIVSIDVDPDSVRCTQKLRESAGNPSMWEVLESSILDRGSVERLGTFDIVYSWGVLHHTGAMWKAIESAMSLVKPGGLLYIAIYNKTDRMGFHPDGRFGSSAFWATEKSVYVHLPRIFQWLVDAVAMGSMILLYLLTLQNPLRKIREHRKLRGMSWAVDITDWLGGYPYEYATVEEISQFVEPRGFRLRRLKSPGGLLNNEFLFQKQ